MKSRRIACALCLVSYCNSSPEVVLRADVVAGPRNPAAGVIGATKAKELAKRQANTSTLAAIICLKAMFVQDYPYSLCCRLPVAYQHSKKEGGDI